MDLVVFSNAGALDFPEVRNEVVRIPEVANKIREVQRAWDKVVRDGTCLFHQLYGDDHGRLLSRNIKTVLEVSVQVGLYERYRKRNSEPKLLIGDVQNTGALSIVTGQKNLIDLIDSLESSKKAEGTNVLPIANGLKFPLYQLFELGLAQYVPLKFKSENLSTLITQAAFEKGARRLISIGPGPVPLSKELEFGALAEVMLLESIDLDPMLNWFWPAVRQA